MIRVSEISLSIYTTDQLIAFMVEGVTKHRTAVQVEAMGAEIKRRIAKGDRVPRAGRPRIEERANTIEAARPWEALGMSRRSWYRRQAEKRQEKRE